MAKRRFRCAFEVRTRHHLKSLYLVPGEGPSEVDMEVRPKFFIGVDAEAVESSRNFSQASINIAVLLFNPRPGLFTIPLSVGSKFSKEISFTRSMPSITQRVRPPASLAAR